MTVGINDRSGGDLSVSKVAVAGVATAVATVVTAEAVAAAVATAVVAVAAEAAAAVAAAEVEVWRRGIGASLSPLQVPMRHSPWVTTAVPRRELAGQVL